MAHQALVGAEHQEAQPRLVLTALLQAVKEDPLLDLQRPPQMVALARPVISCLVESVVTALVGLWRPPQVESLVVAGAPLLWDWVVVVLHRLLAPRGSQEATTVVGVQVVTDLPALTGLVVRAARVPSSLRSIRLRV